jgi:hypothetical protein
MIQNPLTSLYYTIYILHSKHFEKMIQNPLTSLYNIHLPIEAANYIKRSSKSLLSFFLHEAINPKSKLYHNINQAHKKDIIT